VPNKNANLSKRSHSKVDFKRYNVFLDTKQKRVRCHSLYFEPSKVMVAYQIIHKFNSQWERISPSKLDYIPQFVDDLVGYHNFGGFKIKWVIPYPFFVICVKHAVHESGCGTKPKPSLLSWYFFRLLFRSNWQYSWIGLSIMRWWLVLSFFWPWQLFRYLRGKCFCYIYLWMLNIVSFRRYVVFLTTLSLSSENSYESH